MKNLYNFEIKEVKQNYFVLIPEDEITNEQLKKEKSKQITMTKSKNRILSHHRKFFAIMNKFLENIDEQMSIDELLIILKLKTGYYKEIKFNSQDVIVPSSISFYEMDQEEFKMFYDKCVSLMAKVLGVEKSDLENNAENVE